MNDLCKKLDGMQIGRFGINVCTSASEKWITIYSLDNLRDEFDEQLTFSPDELVEFCKKIIEVRDNGD
jgi:hypothetical protein